MEERIKLTINDILKWAWDETQLADALEEMIPGLPDAARGPVEAEVRRHRIRSRWLDEQVEHRLAQVEAEETQRGGS